MTSYFAVLDAFVSELERQFNLKNSQIMKAIQDCLPEASNFLCPENVSVLANAYDIDDGDELLLEAHLAQASLRNGQDL